MRNLIALVILCTLMIACESDADRTVKEAEAKAITADVERKDQASSDLATLALAQNEVIEGTLKHQQDQIDKLQSRLSLAERPVVVQSASHWPVSSTTIIALLLAVLLVLVIGVVIVFIKLQSMTLIEVQRTKHAMRYLAAGNTRRDAIEEKQWYIEEQYR